MFIHWGGYSIPAKGEWMMCQTKTPVDEYKKIAAEFNPVKFDAEQWVAVEKNAGMRYITITSKSPVPFTQDGETVTITLPAQPIDELSTVLCLELGN